MTTFEKLTLGFRVFSLLFGLLLSLWIGSLVNDLTLLAEASNATLQSIVQLIQLGPDAIADVGGGIQEGAVSAGEGIADGVGGIIDSARESLSRED